MKKATWGLGIALVLALVSVFPAFAEAVTVSGTITSIDEVGGTFTLTLADATVYVVTPPAGFDWTSIAVGDAVDVAGDSDGAGNLAATSVAPAVVVSTVSGVVQSVDAATCSFTILTSEGTTLTVTLPEGSDCSGLAVGDTVEVTGTLSDDGSFAASGVVLVPADDDGDEQTNFGFYCSNPEVPHPALNTVAAAHEADYATVLGWFCNGGVGVGGVDKVLDLSEETGKTPEEILEMRKGMGWGKIKKTLAEQAATEEVSGDEVGTESLDDSDDKQGGPPPWANGGGNGNGNGNGNGKGHGKNK